VASALVGGILIGLAASLMWFATGRVAGVSGLVHNALRGAGNARAVSIAFLVGLVSIGAVVGALRAGPAPQAASFGLLVVAGVLSGFGARLSGGCTSGHGVCGVSRLSPRSLIATLTFMGAGMLTVFVVRHLVS
jgi:uncharacterized membrane protein YedE/YeeE